MITLDDYFGKWLMHPDATEQRKANAGLMLKLVNALLLEYPYSVEINPLTKSRISGATYGGFRPQDCPQGAPTSSHKEGRGIDIYDPHGTLDDWLGDTLLAQYGLYRESPDSTHGWTHLSDRAPPSGRRTFRP